VEKPAILSPFTDQNLSYILLFLLQQSALMNSIKRGETMFSHSWSLQAGREICYHQGGFLKWGGVMGQT
jgi:hypothetical protein